VLPDSAVARVEEQLSGACTVEIAAFDEFTALLIDTAATAVFDHIVFDTAPTGHTLRLLALPAAWSTFIGDGTGTSCLGPRSGMADQQHRYTQAVAALSDPTRITLILVARPERASLVEAQRAGIELRALGIAHQRLVINGLFTASAGTDDALAVAWHTSAREALETMPGELAGLPRSTVGLWSVNPVGISELRALAEDSDGAVSPPTGSLAGGELAPLGAGPFHDLIDTIATEGAGLVMTMGKGGIGKTTVAAAVAVALAERGHRVLLTTTDPADHIAEAVGGEVDGLEVDRIDPVAQTVAYTAEVLATAGTGLDDGARAVLVEDLASPCTEEIAVFQAFARVVDGVQSSFVVIDTAPTGHTLLLLDAARSYHRELTR
jgi:arsenite-transporting ATPase